MLSRLYADDAAAFDPQALVRLTELFEQEADGYLRFGRSLLRDAAYEGLPYKVRRRLHSLVAALLEEESQNPYDVAGILSLHYFEAGNYNSSWQYAGFAGKHAQEIYAYVEAADLYTRALESAKRLSDVTTKELSALQTAQADCWFQAAEYRKAAASYASSFRLVKGDKLAEAKLLLKRSWIEEKLGKVRNALTWAARARNAVKDREDKEALSQAARSTSWYASLLHHGGRPKDALRWAERAAIAARAADDQDALGGSLYVMGALKNDQEILQKSLEAYQRSGNLMRQASLLSDLGVACQSQGRWEEALSYYKRSLVESAKIGNLVTVALARINIAEILIDRGELVEAEEQLLKTLPLWKASQYRFFLAACLSLLARLSLRAGRPEEAIKRLEESRSHFVHVGAEDEVPPVDARIAECCLAMGDTDSALALADKLLDRAGSSESTRKLTPLLKRIRAHALMRRGDLAGAREALEASLAVARERNELFEILLTLRSLIALCQFEKVEPPSEVVAESTALRERLQIKALPAIPPLPQ
jgi:tetratricopeptide (TPR) repeat protein